MKSRLLAPSVALLALWLAGCDQLGIESPAVATARRDADGKAIGAACRHAGRAIEDCYLMNKKADKAAVFAGWKEMNDYMKENGIEVVEPKGLPPAPAASVADKGEEEEAPPAHGKHKKGA